MDGKKLARNLKAGAGNYEVKDVIDYSLNFSNNNETYKEGDTFDDVAFKNSCNYKSTEDSSTFSVSDAVENLGFGKFQLFLSVSTGIAWMADSMEMMSLSILPPALHCHFCITNYQQACLTTVVFLGMTLSSPMWGKFGDTKGRKKALWTSVGFLFLFGFISAFSPGYYWLLAFRFFVGIGIGCVPQAITLYTEFLPSSHRARCVALMKFFWASGSCLEVVLALVVMPLLGWQWFLCLSSVPMLIYFFMCYWLPESARYQAVSGKTEKAMETLRRIAKSNKQPMPQGKLTVDDINADRGQFLDLIKPGIRKTTFLVFFIWMSSGFCKYGVIFLSTEILEQNSAKVAQGAAQMNKIVEANYVTTMASNNFEANGLLVNGVCTTTGRPCKVLTTRDYVDLLCITAAEFPAILVTMFMLDKIGRKRTICIQFFLFAVTIVAFAFKIEGRFLTTAILFVAKGVITAAVQAMWVYTPEVYPTSIRAIGLGTGSAMSRIGCMITPYVAQVLSQTSIPLAVCIYGAVGLTAAILAILLPLETKGKALPE